MSGTLTVQAGGILAPACQPITGDGAFALEAGATLRICDADGIMATASSGAVRLTGPRSYSPDAFYEYVGTQAQTTGNGLPANVAGLTLSQAMATQAAILSQGVLNTDAYTLTLPATGTITETDASYVRGRVSVPGRSLTTATAETFGGIGLTLTLTPAAASMAFPGLTNVLRTTGTALTLPGTSPSIQRYFDIQSAINTGMNVTMNFTYFDHERNGIAAANVALYKSVSSLSGPWASQSPITIAANTVTKTGIADFSIWTLGAASAPLPVTLTDFTATRQVANAQLVWNMASEKNNDHFEVEVSTDGRQFQALGNVVGHGTTTQAQRYTFLDKGIARYGVAQLYYRLRQIDTDGTATTSPVRTVRVEQQLAGPATFAVYPTVADGGPVRYLYQGPTLALGTRLKLYDVTSRRVWQQAASAAGADVIALPALSTGWCQVVLLRAEGCLNARFYRP